MYTLLLCTYAPVCPGHRFCHDCLVNYLSSEISDGRVQSLCCPHVDSFGSRCKAKFSSQKLGELLPLDVYNKYDRFVKQQMNDNYRECPKCAWLTVGAAEKPDMECESCHYAFCFEHGDVHAGISCAAYKKASRKKTRESRAKAALSGIWKWAHTKRCPHCLVQIQKNGGCPNSMRTPAYCSVFVCPCLRACVSLHVRCSGVYKSGLQEELLLAYARGHDTL